jgi:hypothetical protein
MPISRPLSPGGGWVEVSLYRVYADLAYENLAAGRYFETIVVSCVGYDVLMNTLLDRIRLHHYGKLKLEEQKVIRNLEAGKKLTAGEILKKLQKANILKRELDRALLRFNEERNKVIHPIVIKKKVDSNGHDDYVPSLKPDAITPQNAKRENAERYFRYFCHIIDLSGGESPRKDERAMRSSSLADDLRQIKEKRRLVKSPKKDNRT